MGLFGIKKRTLVVDLAAVLRAKGNRGNVAPRQQLQVLRSLARVVQRENINVTAVLAGDPLNKAPHNKLLDGVRVRYAKSEDKLEAEFMRALKQAGSAGVLVTENVPLESKVATSGWETLRVSTFRKLLDDGNDSGSSQNGSKQSNGRNRRNNNGRNNNGNDRKKERPKQQNNKAKQNNEKKQSRQDEISQMIDLVD